MAARHSHPSFSDPLDNLPRVAPRRPPPCRVRIRSRAITTAIVMNAITSCSSATTSGSLASYFGTCHSLTSPRL
jgi:hypothetical protein